MMTDILTGWHIAEKFNAKFITITFEESLTAGDTGTLALTDAIDGTSLKTMLETDNFIIFDVFAYADPGFVRIQVLPDADGTKKFLAAATKNPVRVPISPPKMAEVDLTLDYVNENQPNDMYVSFSAMRIDQKKLPEFTLFAESISTAIENMDRELLNVRKVLDNLLALEIAANPAGVVPWDIPQPADKKEERREFCRRG